MDGGSFSITYGLQLAGSPVTTTENNYIYAQSSISKTFTYAGAATTCYCSAVPPTKQVCTQQTEYRTESIWQSLFNPT